MEIPRAGRHSILEILYEDNHILVVVKPHNMPSQKDASNDEDMLSKLKAYIKEKYNIIKVIRFELWLGGVCLLSL